MERTLILMSTGSIMWLLKIYAADDITPGGMRAKLPNWVRYRAPLAVFLETPAQIGSTDTKIFIHMSRGVDHHTGDTATHSKCRAYIKVIQPTLFHLNQRNCGILQHVYRGRATWNLVAQTQRNALPCQAFPHPNGVSAASDVKSRSNSTHFNGLDICLLILFVV